MKLAPLLVLPLAACSGGGGGAPDAGPPMVTVTAPVGAPELLPGASIDIDWTVSGSGGLLAIAGIPIAGGTGQSIFSQAVPVGDGTFPWDGADASGTAMLPDVYQLAFTIDGAPVDSNANVMLHGAFFTDPAIGDTATATGSYDLKLTTVSQRPLDLTLSLGPHIVSTSSINGELVPFGRTLHFAGTDTDGVAVPAGDYQVVLDVQDPSSTLHYSVGGGMLNYTP